VGGCRALAAGLVVIALFAGARVRPVRADEGDNVNPDRPGISATPHTVPRGVVHVETGVEYARERRAGQPDQRRASLVSTLRVGVADRLELRIEGEPLVALRGAENGTNVGDTALGVKWRLLDGADGTLEPTLALLPVVKLATAPDPIGTERWDFALLALASLTFDRLTLELNAGLAAIGQRHRGDYLLQGLVVGGANVDVTGRWTVLGELFFASRSERRGDDAAFGA
jgi:hypothetical protein